MLLLLLLSNPSIAQNKKPIVKQAAPGAAMQVTRILFVLDASSSMLNPWSGKTKIDVARSIISELEDSLETKPGVETALRVYGHQSINTSNDCNDTRLEVPFAPRNAVSVKQMLNNIRPKGITPLALSLEKAAEDFPTDSLSRNIVLLVTDGEESCGGDPCALSLKMQQQHVILKPFVIGLNLDAASKESMACIGSYYNSDNPDALKDIMHTVMERILSSASLRINLLDAEGNAVETDVDMTFYDVATGNIKYNFYHTLNYRGIPDTLQVDPLIEYRLQVNTNPPIERLLPDLSNINNLEVNIPASQGFLKVELTGNTINNNLNNKIKCIVKPAGSPETILVQDINSIEKYLSGKYDLEVLTLPRISIRNVEVTQSATTTVKVEVPGVLSVTKTYPGYGGIFINDNGRLLKIYNLNENLSNELVGLQAGDYKLIYRSKLSKKTSESVIKTFHIKSGESAAVKL